LAIGIHLTIRAIVLNRYIKEFKMRCSPYSTQISGYFWAGGQDENCALIGRAHAGRNSHARYSTMTRWIFWLLGTAGVLICLASGQTAAVGSSSAKSGSDLKSVTKPLTAKSAMPAPHKSSPSVPATPTRQRSTNAELTRLEGQGMKPPAAKSGKTGAAKSSPVKPLSPSPGSGSGINASYQKPRVK